MLYKHSFSILCGHLNLNQKRKKIEFSRLPVKPTGIPVRTGCTAKFEFKFEFHRYRPVSGQTEPVSDPAVMGATKQGASGMGAEPNSPEPGAAAGPRKYLAGRGSRARRRRLPVPVPSAASSTTTRKAVSHRTVCGVGTRQMPHCAAGPAAGERWGSGGARG